MGDEIDVDCVNNAMDSLIGHCQEFQAENAALKAEVASLRNNQQANTAIALAERYKRPFSSTSVIGKVMDGFIYWLQEQQQ